MFLDLNTWAILPDDFGIRYLSFLASTGPYLVRKKSGCKILFFLGENWFSKIDLNISPYKNFNMFKSVFENQFSPWKKCILHPVFFFRLGMDLYLPKIATILSQSRCAAEAKCLGPKTYSYNLFFGEPLTCNKGVIVHMGGIRGITLNPLRSAIALCVPQ